TFASFGLLAPRRTRMRYRHGDGVPALGCSAGLAFELQQPVRAALLIGVKQLANVAAHALGDDDFALADRAPFAGVFAELTSAALGPALYPEHGQRRQQTERGA